MQTNSLKGHNSFELPNRHNRSSEGHDLISQVSKSSANMDDSSGKKDDMGQVEHIDKVTQDPNERPVFDEREAYGKTGN